MNICCKILRKYSVGNVDIILHYRHAVFSLNIRRIILRMFTWVYIRNCTSGCQREKSFENILLNGYGPVCLSLKNCQRSVSHDFRSPNAETFQSDSAQISQFDCTRCYSIHSIEKKINAFHDLVM